MNQVIMDLNEYLDLRKAAEMFYALKEAGVDNWPGYEKAIAIYEESNDVDQ